MGGSVIFYTYGSTLELNGQQFIAAIIAHIEQTAKMPNLFCVPASSDPLENTESRGCREHKIELGVKKTCR